MTMTFNEYQAKALSTAKPTSLTETYLIPGLVAEAGEVAGHYAKFQRDGYLLSGDPVPAILKELGDVLWFVAVLCSFYGVGLEEVAQANVDKLRDRMQRGVIGGKGDDR